MQEFNFSLLCGTLLLFSALAGAQPKVEIEKVPYKGWPNSYRMTNGQIELILTADVGPRIIRLGFVGEENEFHEHADQVGQTGGDEWRNYGGHRLWHAPEVHPRTYFPDNFPIEVRAEGGYLHAIQPVEETTGIQKEIEIRMAADAPRIEVLHRLRNKNPWAVELAAWALSVMAAGGHAIIPMPPRAKQSSGTLQPTHPLVLWSYTDFRDPRWTLGFKYVLLRQGDGPAGVQKVGMMVPDGWSAYLRNDHLFVKKFDVVTDATYPDFGSSVETFTNPELLEVETLSPLTKLAPGATVEHRERWWLYKGVKLESWDEEAIDRVVLPRVRDSR